MPEPLSEESLMPLRLAVALVAATGVLLVGVGVASMLQFDGRFSLGVGAMLVLYGLFVCLAAWLGHRRHMLAFGAMTALTVLHVLVVISTAQGSHAWWLWLFLIPLGITLAGLMAPSTRRALGRYGTHD